MKKLFIIEDTVANKISYYLLAAFLIGLPFNRFYSEWLLIIFCLHTLIHFKVERLKRLKNKKVWIAASVFFLSLLTLSYSHHSKEGVKDAIDQVAIFLFPVFLSINNLKLPHYKYRLLEIFGLTCVITLLFLYFKALQAIFYFHLPFTSLLKAPFLNQNFTAPIELHATYFSMYVLLSICIFLFLFYAVPAKRNKKYIFFSLILLAGLLQLGSRATIIAAFIILVFVFPFLLLNGKKRKFFLIAALSLSTLITFAIFEVGSLRKRYVSDLENDLSEKFRDPGDLTESRMARWKLEWQLIEKSPFLGYGTGSEKFVLNEKYFENKYYRSFLLSLNSHNQFLSFWLTSGLAGLLVYLYVFYFSLKISIKRKDFLLLSLITVLFIVSFSENILDVSKGVLFYGFFLPFLLFDPVEKGAATVLKRSGGNRLLIHHVYHNIINK